MQSQVSETDSKQIEKSITILPSQSAIEEAPGRSLYLPIGHEPHRVLAIPSASVKACAQPAAGQLFVCKRS